MCWDQQAPKTRDARKDDPKSPALRSLVEHPMRKAGGEPMARVSRRPQAARAQDLEPLLRVCPGCGAQLYAVYRIRRTVTTLEGLCRLTLQVRQCRNPDCMRCRCPYRPEAEGAWALPHGEFGLDVIALVGSLRYTSHRSVPEIHQALCDRGVTIAERTVTHLLQRYEELVALHLAEKPRLRDRFKKQGQVILALDGLQPDVGHEVLWVLRDCLSGEVLLARSLLSACEADLAPLLREVQHVLDVPIRGVISEADRHAKKELKKCIRGVRPIERAVEKRDDAEAEAIRGYCHAVRSALTDDGRAPLEAPGLKLHKRLSAIAASLTRVSEKGACRVS